MIDFNDPHGALQLSGRVLDSTLRGCGFDQASLATLHCVLGQDTLILAYILVQTRKSRPDITEKLLTGA